MPTQDTGFQELIAREYNRLLEQHGPLVAQAMGDPPNTKRVGDERALDLWEYRAPNVDPGALLSQGMSPEDVTVQLHPYRADMLKRAGPKIADQVTYAERMRERAMARQAERDQQSQSAMGQMGIEHTPPYGGEGMSANGYQ